MQEEVELHAGDLIYLPRGFIHSASSRGSSSLHLTVGAVPVTWASVIRGAVESCIEQDARFRASLPPGFAKHGAPQDALKSEFADMMRLIAEQADPEWAVGQARERARRGQRAESLEGRLLDLEAESQISLGTRLRLRPGLEWSVVLENGHLVLGFNNKLLRMPADVQPEMERLTQMNEFTPAALAGELDEAGTLA